jgi:hypothetical protein
MRRTFFVGRDEEAPGVLVGDRERVVLAVVQARREDAGRDAEVVHERDQVVDADPARAVTAEVPGDVGVLTLAEELRGGRGGDEVDPDVEDVHAVAHAVRKLGEIRGTVRCRYVMMRTACST